MKEPRLGDTRVRFGYLETYVMKEYPGKFGSKATTEPRWERTEKVAGTREVEIYSEGFSFHYASLSLAPSERVLGVEGLSGGDRVVWIERTLGGPRPKGEIGWRALLAIEGEETSDGRILAAGSVTWRDSPLPLMASFPRLPPPDSWLAESMRTRMVLVGRIDMIWRDGNKIWGEGVFGTDEFGAEIADLVRTTSGVGIAIDTRIGNVTTEGDAMADAEVTLVIGEAEIMAATVGSVPAFERAVISIREEGDG